VHRTHGKAKRLALLPFFDAAESALSSRSVVKKLRFICAKTRGLTIIETTKVFTRDPKRLYTVRALEDGGSQRTL
jgi:hypothetical protein